MPGEATVRNEPKVEVASPAEFGEIGDGVESHLDRMIMALVEASREHRDVDACGDECRKFANNVSEGGAGAIQAGESQGREIATDTSRESNLEHTAMGARSKETGPAKAVSGEESAGEHSQGKKENGDERIDGFDEGQRGAGQGMEHQQPQSEKKRLIDVEAFPQSKFVMAVQENESMGAYEDMEDSGESAIQELFRIAIMGMPGNTPQEEKQQLRRQRAATGSASVSAELQFSTFVQGRHKQANYECRAVLDRGAHKSFVSVAQLRDWVRSGVQVDILDGKRSKHVAFGGQIVETLGRVRAKGYFRGESKQMVTIVAEVSTDSLFNLLLGLDFIVREDVLVVPSTGRLYLCKGMEVKIGAPSVGVEVRTGSGSAGLENAQAQAILQPAKCAVDRKQYKCHSVKVTADGTPLMVCVPKFDVVASVVEGDGRTGGSTTRETKAGKRSREDVERELKSVEHYEELLKVLEVDKMALSEEEKEQVRALIKEYQDCFALKMDQLGEVNLLKAQIQTGSHPPIRCAPYRVGPKERELIEAEIDKMLEAGVIRPSMSPWASPVVLVAKADGSVRFAIDYRRLNAIATKDAYPLPRINDYLDVLGGARYFSILDALSGFWQIAMEEEPQGQCVKCGGGFHNDTSIQKTAFITHAGLFEWTRLPFGLTSSPSIYQRVMDEIFRGLIWKEMVVYVDDICSYAQTFQEAIERLARVLTRLRAANMKVKAQKCKLFREAVKFLGFLITKDGVTVDPDKMKPIIQLKIPENKDELHTFLGLLVYYSQHIPDFARKTEVLWAVIKGKHGFPLVDSRLQAVEILKQDLVSPKVLCFPDWELPFEVHTDASRNPGALGAVLLQRDKDKSERVLGFYSRLLHGAEHNYSVTELECLAVRWAVQKLRPYLYGRRFTVVTDHVALKWMFSLKDPNPRLNRWVDYLRGFDFDIVYRPGKKHQDADALSRLIKRPSLDEAEAARRDAVNVASEPLELGGYRPDEGEEDARMEGSRPSLGTDYIDEGPGGEPENPDIVAAVVSSVEQYERAKGHLSRGDLNRIRTKMASALVNMAKGNSAIWRLLVEEQAKDRWLQSIRARLESGEVVRANTQDTVYALEDGMVYALHRAKESEEDSEVQDRMCVVVPARLRHQILSMYHGELPLGHMDRTKTLVRLRRLFYWDGMGKEVRAFVQRCAVCQRANHKELNQGVLHSWTVTQPFAVVGMDCLVLPRSYEGRTHVLVMVDLFTRYAEVQPLSGAPNAEEVAQIFISKIILRHGACGAILTDKGVEFMNTIMGEVCEKLCIEHVSVPTQVHSANGLAERLNRTLQHTLAKATGTVSTIAGWDALMEAAVFAYNTAYQEALQDSPFFVLYGRDAVLPSETWVFNPESRVRYQRDRQGKKESRTEFMRRFESIWDRAAQATKKVVTRRLKDSKRKDVSFEVGQQVWVYIPEIFRDGVHQKLLFKWHGPYRVIEEVSQGVLYKVRTERGRNLTQVFHVCRLKEYLPHERRPEEQIVLDEDGEPHLFTFGDITPSSAKLESAEWRRLKKAQALGTTGKKYMLVQEPPREPTSQELSAVGKVFIDDEGRWIVTSVAYHPEHRVVVAFYEKLLDEKGEWVPAGQEAEYSSLAEVWDWIALSSSKVHHA